MIVKDAMILIHLAKLTVLSKACSYFEKVLVPHKVYEEVLAGKGKDPSVLVFEKLVGEKKILVEKAINGDLVKKAHDFNIEKGEAEALALYWEKKADFLASDDQNVRRKTLILDLKIVGTLEIVLMLYRNGLISGEKAIDSLNELKRIGWFNSAVIEAALLEVKQ